jgi:hypothetical protein
MEKRATSMAPAEPPLGISGTSASKMLDGRCEATIVSIAPNLRGRARPIISANRHTRNEWVQ